MEYKNDLNLLRQFNRAAAEAGEPICTMKASPRTFVKYEDNISGFPIVTVDLGGGVQVISEPDTYRMAPLTWKEGKPVYKGDVMFYVRPMRGPITTKVTITGFHDTEGFFDTEEFGPRSISFRWVTWEEPKTEQVSSPYVPLPEGAKWPDPPKPEQPRNEAVDSRVNVDKFFAMVKQLRTHAVHLECPRKDWIEEFDALLAQAEVMSKMPSVTVTIDTQDAVAALSSAKEAVTSDLLAATRSELDRANATLAEMVGCTDAIVNILNDMLKKTGQRADIMAPHIDFSVVRRTVIPPGTFKSEPPGEKL